ncbi:MAG: SPOR domain-containing protein [Crocinitomicaceae bacterium]|nr:SPOR domain-containing protein [Crocinitomicaceae bacterium]
MNNYLIELFKEENTVIIPGFGALTMVNRAKNELMFMGFMKHNDGTLVKYIASKDGVDEATAMAKLVAYVDDIKNAIDNGKVFDIPGVGSFSKDNAGDVSFSQNDLSAESAQNTITIKEEPKEEVVVEEKVAEVEEALTEVEEKVTEVVEEVVEEKEVKEEPITPIVSDKIATTIVETPTSKETPVSEEEQWNDDLDLPPLNYQPERPKKPILEKAKKDGLTPHKRKTVLFFLLAILIVGGAAFLGFNKDFRNKIPFLASKTTNAEQVVGENTKNDEVEEEVTQEEEIADESNSNEEQETFVQEEKKEPTVEKPQPKVVASGNLRVDQSLPIQIIVGSFGVEDNANRLVDKLKSMGFPAAIINQGNLFVVTVASFSSMEEYQANSEQLKQVGNYWVKK